MVDLVPSGRSPDHPAREFEPSAQSIRNWRKSRQELQQLFEEKLSLRSFMLGRSAWPPRRELLDGLRDKLVTGGTHLMGCVDVAVRLALPAPRIGSTVQ